MVPRRGIILGIVWSPLEGMKNFSPTSCVIAVIPEVLGEDHGLFEGLGFMSPSGSPCAEHIAINAGPDRVNTRHDRDSRRMANRSGAVGVSEIYRAAGKALKMWSLDPGVIIEWRDIIVQVVNCDKEDVGFTLNREPSQRETDDECQEITHCFTGEEG